jgi:predicted kinase
MALEKIHGCDIVLLGGLYGSGKSEFAMRYFSKQKRYRISRQEIRKLIYEMTSFNQQWTGDRFNEEDDSLVKHVERKIMEHYLHHNRGILIINTFMTAESRKRFIAMAKEKNKTIGMVFLDAAVDRCLKKNREKPSGVSDQVLYNLSARKEKPSIREGFNQLVIIEDPETMT